MLAEREIDLVYGGGAVGLMGLVVDTVLEAGNRHGRDPDRTLLRGGRPSGAHHAGGGRHDARAEVTDVRPRRAFIALPGGFGTLEELAEVLTWNQIGLLAKPVGVLDVGGFWQPLLHLLDTMVDKTILKAQNRELLSTIPTRDRCSTGWRTNVVHEPKWVGEERT